MMSRGKCLLLVALSGLIAAFFAAGLHHHVSLQALQQNRAALVELVHAYPILAPFAYFLLYAALAGLTLPLNIPLSLWAGALFGFAEGTLVVSFGSATGATLSFLSSRFLLRDIVRRRLGDRLREVEAGIAEDGVFYLLTLRLAPVVPYTVINLLFGLTAIPVWRFYLVGQIGMLPATMLYVNAGTQLEQLHGLSSILSPALIGSLLLLAVVPLVAKRAVSRWRRARA